MSAHHDPPVDALPSVTGLWARHWRAMLVSGLVSLSAMGSVYLWAGGSPAEATVTVVGVQLLVMAVVLPAAALGGRNRMDVLCRGGAVSDAFGAGLMTAAMLTEEFSWLAALKIYLLVSTVGLVCLGVFWVIRRSGAGRGRAAAAVVASFGLAVGIWAGLYAGTGGVSAGREATVARRMLANADLRGAVSSCVGLTDSRVPWYGVLMVYAAAAGMVWTIPLVVGSEPRGAGRDEVADTSDDGDG